MRTVLPTGPTAKEMPDSATLQSTEEYARRIHHQTPRWKREREGYDQCGKKSISNSRSFFDTSPVEDSFLSPAVLADPPLAHNHVLGFLVVNMAIALALASIPSDPLVCLGTCRLLRHPGMEHIPDA